MYSISVCSSSALGARAIETLQTEPINSISRSERSQDQVSAPKRTFRTTTKTNNYVWYRGLFGHVDVQSMSTSLSRSDAHSCENKATSTQDIIRITPILLHKTFELRFGNSFGQISRTLSTYPILRNDAPIFKLCQRGDLQGLQVLLSSGIVSPFALDQHGQSLLQVSILYTKNIR